MGEWLEERDAGKAHRFRVAFYDEREGWRAAGAAEAMASLLRVNSAGPGLVRDVERHSGWSKAHVRNLLAPSIQPAGSTQRQGKFGEVLHADILERFCAMIIPVKRHRYNPAPGTSPRGTDIVALGGPAEGGVERIVYAETKLRNSAVPAAMAEAHRALAATADEELPPSLKTVMEVLENSDADMYERVMEASLCGAGAHFRIGAVVERSAWKDGHLDRLEREQDANRLDLGVDVVKIGGVDELVDESFRVAVAG